MLFCCLLLFLIIKINFKIVYFFVVVFANIIYIYMWYTIYSLLLFIFCCLFVFFFFLFFVSSLCFLLLYRAIAALCSVCPLLSVTIIFQNNIFPLRAPYCWCCSQHKSNKLLIINAVISEITTCEAQSITEFPFITGFLLSK